MRAAAPDRPRREALGGPTPRGGKGPRPGGYREADRGGAEPLAVVTPAFFDTSVLVAGLIDFGEGSGAAQRVMTAIAERHVRSPQTAWH